ncbi:hypothetical protein [Angelakisella massiliensis]|uniref:hypothetical protein n=1 Tax=Angelakisella massiliensis TaxID=1871018 RepID=UPI0008F85D08|nr:hypothetical protein [Angelakisella massiliensis]
MKKVMADFFSPESRWMVRTGEKDGLFRFWSRRRGAGRVAPSIALKRGRETGNLGGTAETFRPMFVGWGLFLLSAVCLKGV